MKYHCTADTDLDELIGRDGSDSFQYGPLAVAMKSGEHLELENSAALSAVMVAKLEAFRYGLFIVETEETLRAQPSFSLLLQ